MLILYLLERGSPVSATSTASSSGMWTSLSTGNSMWTSLIYSIYRQLTFSSLFPESDIESDKGEGAAAASPAAAESNMVGVTSEPIYRNKELVIHHLITAALCVSSYFSGTQPTRIIRRLCLDCTSRTTYIQDI